MPAKKGAKKPAAKKSAAKPAEKPKGRGEGKKFTKGNPYAWRKGQSGNPEGKPKLFETMFRQAMAKIFRTPNPKTGNTNIGDLAQCLFDSCARQVEKGKIDRSIAQMTMYMIDQVEGKPSQPIILPDWAKFIEGKTEQENDFFARHGYWPGTALDAGQPGAGTPESSS